MLIQSQAGASMDILTQKIEMDLIYEGKDRR